MKVKNYDGLVQALMEGMATLDAHRWPIQTDVYLYVDEDASWRLEEFENVGGNSWKDDDHILLYVDKPHYDEAADWAEDMTDEEIASELLSMYHYEYKQAAWNALTDAEIEE